MSQNRPALTAAQLAGPGFLTYPPRPQNGQQQIPANMAAPNHPRRRCAQDYQFGTKIGEGSYSTVYLAVDLYNNKTYAVKVLSKKHIVQEGKIKYVNIEKTTLHRLGVQHPGIVQLYFTFQDELSLFFVLDFAEYGELLSIISKFGTLLEAVLKFYMLQILDAVQFIHLKGVIHRDLKPENILVGYDFNLKITDFGAAKLLGDADDNDEKVNYDSVSDLLNLPLDRKGSFVGTAEYVPPELLKFNTCGFETDIWAIGCILYQFFNGSPPFKGATEYLTFEKIISVSYQYKEQLPTAVKDIIESILKFEPSKRPTIPQIQAMPWFAGVPWNNRDYIWQRKVPRFEPYVHNAKMAPPAPINAAPPMGVPHMRTGANRNLNKLNSNFQLHSQILKFDNLVPAFKAQHQPPTRLKKGVPPPLNLQPGNPGMPVPLNYSDKSAMAPPSPGVGQWRQPPVNMRQEYSNPPHFTNNIPNGNSGQMNMSAARGNGNLQAKHNNSYGNLHNINNMNSTANKAGSAQGSAISDHVNANMASHAGASASTNAAMRSPVDKVNPGKAATLPQYIAAKQAATKPVSPVEQSTDSKPKVPNSPKLRNLRQDTAFAQFKSKSRAPTAEVPRLETAEKKPETVEKKPEVAERKPEVSQKKPEVTPEPRPASVPPTESPSKVSHKKSNSQGARTTAVVTLREISSFLGQDEKIIKLDVVLKLMLSNRLIDRTPGSLDNDMIEYLIEQHQAILDTRMTPVIACVTNKAKVFLIDDNLDVMMVDLTANKGGDYLMYDYEFESIVVDDDDDEDKGEEVFGYLILELIKEGGDLIFLKRLSKADNDKYGRAISVVGANGDTVQIGANFGWIDCLIRAKDLVDREQLESRKPQAPEAKISRSPKNKIEEKKRSKAKASPKLKPRAKEDSKPYNNFAYAAAAAVHKQA